MKSKLHYNLCLMIFLNTIFMKKIISTYSTANNKINYLNSNIRKHNIKYIFNKLYSLSRSSYPMIIYNLIQI